jgi:hypothetical protein
MKKLALMLALTALASAAFAQNESPGPAYQNLLFSGVTIKNVESITEGGYINVIAADPQNAGVTVYLKCAAGQMSDSEIALDLKENYQFKVGMDGDTLKAQLIRKSGDLPAAKRLWASFLIRVPANVNTQLSTAGGDITLDGLNGSQNFVTSGGRLAVLRVSGDIKGATSGGDVVAESCKQIIDLSTSGGQIIAAKCEGKINLSTSGGKIILADLDGDIKASTSGGDVIGKNIKGNLNASDVAGNVVLAGLSCTVDATTTKGNMYVDVSGLKYTTKLNVNGGDLKLILPKQLNADLNLSGDKIVANDLDNFKGTKDNSKISGQLNNGGASLTATATGGTMDVKSN